MRPGALAASPNHAPLLLIEADSYARLEHELALRAAGYQVRAFATCPGPVDLHYASAVLTDPASFEVMQLQPARPSAPVVVLAEDDRAGVTACLRGAAAWAPAHGQPEYLVDTVGGVLHANHGGDPVSPRE